MRPLPCVAAMSAANVAGKWCAVVAGAELCAAAMSAAADVASWWCVVALGALVLLARAGGRR